jgi:uncharacterized protein (TIGR03435 family)
MTEGLRPAVAGLIIAAASAASGIFAQSPAVRPTFDEFEVATIKPSTLDWPSGGRYMRMQTAHQFVARNYTLRVILSAAYNLTPRAVSGGPEWVDSDRFDILAEAPGEVRPTLDEQMAMLRKLLAERFSLALHREPKEYSIYALTIAKNGPKLMEAAPNTSPEGSPPLVFVLYPDMARLAARDATMGELASVMQRSALDRPVVDKTGLLGRYDFDLEWMPDETQFSGNVPKGDPDHPKADLFAAMQQQLGLKLEATRGPIEALVIDKVERSSAN